MLWGGITLPDTTAGQHPPREKISEFFLTTFHSFMHPLLLMRLLLHRLATTREPLLTLTLLLSHLILLSFPLLLLSPG